MIDPKYLLNDQQKYDYITQGFLVLKTDLPSSVHEQIYRRTSEVMEKEGNPGNNILPRVPELKRVFADPTLRGALTSVLGADSRHSSTWPEGRVSRQAVEQVLETRLHAPLYDAETGTMIGVRPSLYPLRSSGYLSCFCTGKNPQEEVYLHAEF